MTTYTSIPNGDIDQDSPVTQVLMTLLRDNPIGIIEGASGAPRIWPEALAQYVGEETTAGNYITVTDDISDIGFVDFIGRVFVDATTTATAELQIQLSSNGGSTWSSDKVLFDLSSTPDPETANFHLRINLATGSIYGPIVPSTPAQLTQNQTFATTAGYNAIRARVNLEIGSASINTRWAMFFPMGTTTYATAKAQ